MQRVPGEFAAWLGGEARAAAAVLLVSPLGKVWHADLRRAGGGGGPGPLQLAGGWAEFAAAHGVRAGWSVVFRLERRGWPPSGRSTRPAASRDSARLSQVNIIQHKFGLYSATTSKKNRAQLGKLGLLISSTIFAWLRRGGSRQEQAPVHQSA